MEGLLNQNITSAGASKSIDISNESSGNYSTCHCCGEKVPEYVSEENIVNTSDSNFSINGKLSKLNILDKLNTKLNQLNKLNARVQKCNANLENFNSNSFSCTFQSKLDFENFLRDTYNDSRYSYCILNCGPSVPYRQLKSMEIKDERIPWNMGWNWKKNHDQNWQPGRLPKIIKIRMSHFLNYYPCDTLPTSRLNMKLLKNSFNDCANSEVKIKKMIRNMRFSPCVCNKSIAWCMCRDKKEMNKLKKLLELIEDQIGESGLEYKLYLNDMTQEKSKMSFSGKQIQSYSDIINQETQYDPMDVAFYKNTASRKSAERLCRPKNIKSNSKPITNNSIVTIPKDDSIENIKKLKNK